MSEFHELEVFVQVTPSAVWHKEEITKVIWAEVVNSDAHRGQAGDGMSKKFWYDQTGNCGDCNKLKSIFPINLVLA